MLGKSAVQSGQESRAKAQSVDWSTARELSGRVAAAARHSFARNFTAAVVESFWQELVLTNRAKGSITLPTDIEISKLTRDARDAAHGLGEAIAAAPLAEAAQLLGAVYTSVLPDDVRTTHGIFYTPPALVGRLMTLAEEAGIEWRTARVLDPACGCGAFIIPLAFKIVDALEGSAPAIVLQNIAARLRGYDIDPFGAWLAQTALTAALQPLSIAAKRAVPIVIEARDSLRLRDEEFSKTDLVIGNPPYGRVTLSPDQRRAFSRSVYGHANMYGLFADAALHWITKGGIAAYVTPTSMMSGLYFKALRSLLANSAAPVSMEFVSERTGVFEDVQQETMLATYRKGCQEDSGRVGFITLTEDGDAKIRFGGNFSLPADPAGPWLLPRSPGQTTLARRLQKMPARLSDYGYEVSTGPLVWNRFKSQFLAAPKTGSYPVIWAEAVTSKGTFEWRSEKRNHAPWFKANLPKDEWLIVKRPCVLLQRTTAKEQARRLIAAELPPSFVRKHDGVIVENHLNMVRATSTTPKIRAEVIALLLNSEAVDAAFRCISGSVAVSAFELEEMPLPSLEQAKRLEQLMVKGAKRETLEAAIAAMYDGKNASATR